jgi:hypothetical protein
MHLAAHASSAKLRGEVTWEASHSILMIFHPRRAAKLDDIHEESIPQDPYSRVFQVGRRLTLKISSFDGECYLFPWYKNRAQREARVFSVKRAVNERENASSRKIVSNMLHVWAPSGSLDPMKLIFSDFLRSFYLYYHHDRRLSNIYLFSQRSANQSILYKPRISGLLRRPWGYREISQWDALYLYSCLLLSYSFL